MTAKYDHRSSNQMEVGQGECRSTRKELEINLGWASEHPDLFHKTVTDFLREVPGDWNMVVDRQHTGYVSFIATPKEA